MKVYVVVSNYNGANPFVTDVHYTHHGAMEQVRMLAALEIEEYEVITEVRVGLQTEVISFPPNEMSTIDNEEFWIVNFYLHDKRLCGWKIFEREVA